MTRARLIAFTGLLALAALGCPSKPPPTPPVPMPPVTDDPINHVDIAYLRNSAAEIMRDLVAALPDRERALMAPVPLVNDDEPGFVNAFATCKDNVPKMAITDELLRIQAHLSRARATDEIFGTKKFDEYLSFLSANTNPDEAVPPPPAGLFEDGQDTEARKVNRQHQLFEEELAFVMGHEIAHHYLGHTGCVGTPHPLITLGSILSGELPIFNQPFELAADSNGTTNMLNAGARRPNYQWNEGGALMTLTFFGALEQITANDSLLYAFVMSHPPAGVRMPVVTQAADNWRRAQPRPPIPPRD